MLYLSFFIKIHVYKNIIEQCENTKKLCNMHMHLQYAYLF